MVGCITTGTAVGPSTGITKAKDKERTSSDDSSTRSDTAEDLDIIQTMGVFQDHRSLKLALKVV